MTANKIRICITRSSRSSYSETFIRDQIAGFKKRATVFTVHSGRLPEREENGNLLAPFAFWVLHKIIKALTGNRNNYFGNFGLKKFFIKNKVQVVLANYGLSGAHFVTICRDLQIPLLVIFHGHDATDYKILKQYTRKYKILFQFASSVIVVSQEMKQRIVQMGVDDKKVKVIPCGVDVEKFKPSMVKKEKFFLAVGRFTRKKGPAYTIQAFHKVWLKYPEVKLVMVGAPKGKTYNDCVDLVKTLNITDAVDFVGILKQQEIAELMSRALAFVQHSVIAPNGDMEGTPVSVLEACASGLPVVSTLHGGIKDAVLNGISGYLVEEGDVDGMAVSMEKLVNDPTLSQSMGNAGRLHIEKNYSQDNQIQALYDLAQEAVAVQSALNS